MLGAFNLGGWAALVAAFGWFGLAFFLALMLVNVFRMLESTKMLIDSIRQETVPMLREVRTTVTSVNRELDRVDDMLQSANKMARNAERLSAVVEKTVSSPLIKVAAWGAGVSRAARRLRGD